MLKLAETMYPSCTFDKVDLLDKLPYENSQFDIVFCSLVLMDIDPIDCFISEAFRILKTGGKFFFSIVHPAFYLADWERNEHGVILSKKVTRYITPCENKQNAWGTTTLYHRPISYYFNLLSDYGFCLRKMYEPSVYEEEKIPDIPLYLFAEFQK